MGKHKSKSPSLSMPTWETLEGWLRKEIEVRIQSIVEEEVTQFLGRGWYERKEGYIRISQRDEVGEGAVVPGMGARLECAESAGSVLDDLDDSVEAFGDGVGKTRVHECEDAEEVLSQGPDELSQGFKSTF